MSLREDEDTKSQSDHYLSENGRNLGSVRSKRDPGVQTTVTWRLTFISLLVIINNWTLKPTRFFPLFPVFSPVHPFMLYIFCVHVRSISTCFSLFCVCFRPLFACRGLSSPLLCQGGGLSDSQAEGGALRQIKSKYRLQTSLSTNQFTHAVSHLGFTTDCLSHGHFPTTF